MKSQLIKKKEQVRSYEPLKEKRSEKPRFFKRVFSYFKNTIKAIFDKKEEVQAPQTPYKAESDITSPLTNKIQQSPLIKEQTIPAQKPQDVPRIQAEMMADNIPIQQQLSTNNSFLFNSSTTQHNPFRVPL